MRALGIVLLVAAVIPGSVQAEHRIYLGEGATALERRAAEELQRYTYAATGVVWEIRSVSQTPSDATGFVLGTPESLPASPAGTWPFGLEPPRHDGYLLHTSDGGALLAIAGATAEAVQNGVYGFLYDQGVSFYLSGDTFPLEVPDLTGRRMPNVHASHSPVVAVRGTVVRDDYRVGPGAWSFADWRHYIDQLVKLRLNTLVVHAREGSPFLGGSESEPAPGFGSDLSPDHFLAGTGLYFAEEPESDAPARLRRVFEYAAARGLQVGLGFEVRGDATDPQVQADLGVRLRRILQEYPTLDHVWLWAPELSALRLPGEPPYHSPWGSLTRREADDFAYLDDVGRRAEAVRMALHVLQARQTVQALRPGVKVSAAGWGGEASLRFTEFLPGLDRMLPADVVLSPVQDLPLRAEPVDTLGALSPERQAWPVFALEYDGDLWMPQPNLTTLSAALDGTLRQGCEGILGMHWRTRAADDAAAFLALRAWIPDLSVEAYHARRARDLYGPTLGDDLAPFHARMDELGYRWVGGLGQHEPAPFVWSRGSEASRTRLIRAASELRERLSREGVEPRLIPDVTEPLEFGIGILTVPFEMGRGLVERPLRTGRRILTAPVGVGRDLAEAVLPIELSLPTWKPSLDDLYTHIRFVLTYDAAAAALEPGGAFDVAVERGDADAALRAVKAVRLAELFDLYAQRVQNEGERGVLEEMNRKAWADVRARLVSVGADPSELEALPATYRDTPLLRVLPDRVIVVSPDVDEARVRVRARRLGGRGFNDRPLTRVGNGVYRLEFPEEVEEWGNFEYGVEARLPGGKTLVWPVGFPDRLRRAHAGGEADRPPVRLPGAASATSPDLKYEIGPDSRSLRLTWTLRAGEAYTVFRDGEAVATVFAGEFRDAAPAAAEREYRVEARHLATDDRAVATVRVPPQALPLPAAPRRVTVRSRGGWNVLQWDSDDPLAAEYVVTVYGRGQEKLADYRVPADHGHNLSFAHPVASGEARAYAVAAVDTEGRIGSAGAPVGIIARPGSLEPVVHLRTENEAELLGNLAPVGAAALALGGPGGSDLPRQRDWDPARPLTLALWVKFDNLFGMPVLMEKGPWIDPAFYLQVFDGGLRFHLAGVGTLDAGRLETGVWTHVAATYADGDLRLYIDGREVGRKRADGQQPAPLEPLLAARYGVRGEPGFVEGVMDDIRIYDVALAPQEMTALLESARPR